MVVLVTYSLPARRNPGSLFDQCAADVDTVEIADVYKPFNVVVTIIKNFPVKALSERDQLSELTLAFRSSITITMSA